MNRKATERVYRARLLMVMLLLAGVVTGCAHQTPRLYAPMQPDGWSVQPIAISCRFAPDADLDPATGTPVGDEGYYLYILNEAANWDYSNTKSLLLSIRQRPWAHSWLILESPGERLECGHTGDFGLTKPRFHDGVFQGIRDGVPNPIAYLWQTMSDGQFQIGKPNRPPTFVWRMPITKRRHQLIYEYAMQRKYDQFGVRIPQLHRYGDRSSGAGGHQPDSPHSTHLAAGNKGLGSDGACLDGSPIPHTGVQHARRSGNGSAPAYPVRNRE